VLKMDHGSNQQAKMVTKEGKLISGSNCKLRHCKPISAMARIAWRAGKEKR
jgi:hypothetical protein